jgi:hypothetical protein
MPGGDLIYASEKLSKAVRLLGCSDDPLAMRLERAWIEGSFARPMGPGQAGIPMSDDLLARILALSERMSAVPAKADEGSIRSTISAMSVREMIAAADELLDIYFEVEAALEEAYAAHNELLRRRPSAN